ncbi:MAG: DUF4870 family protein [Sulfurovaceae bacterium]
MSQENKILNNFQDPNKNIALIVYGLQILGILTGGIAWIIGIVINYVKKDDVAGTWIESHFEWQIQTFWISLFWFVISLILFVTVVLIPVAWIIWVVAGIWVIYRIVKGLLDLLDNKAILLKK